MYRASMWREVTHMVTPIRGTERDESVSVMRCAAERGGRKWGKNIRLAWMAAKLVSSNKETRYASAAS